MRRHLSSIAWAAFMIVMGAAMAFALHASPAYCVAFPSFCRLPPHGSGLYPLCIAGMLLLGGCIDMARGAIIGRPVLGFPKWQTITAAVCLLVWLWAGFRGGVPS